MSVRIREYSSVGGRHGPHYKNGKPKPQKHFDVIWNGSKASTHNTRADANKAAKVLRDKDKRLAAAKRKQKR